MRPRIVVVGAGAAGLMAGIWAGRTHPDHEVLILDGAAKLGAKILVAGGGRCNVTHDQVEVSAYAGSSRNAIRKVIQRFNVPETVAFFEPLGVPLKREETGKLFPVSNQASTVLNALLQAVADAGATIQHPCRVDRVDRLDSGFRVVGMWGELQAERLILATGGKSLPKSGSDGGGYTIAQSLGHSLTRRIFPALVPLTLPPEHFICSLSGLTTPARLDLHAATGKKLVSFTNSTLCTHFGLSGPSVLDISRYYSDAIADDPDAYLTINWLPDKDNATLEADLLNLGSGTVLRYLTGQIPERLIRALCAQLGVEATISGAQLTRDKRKKLVEVLTELRLPITGDRGYNYAEVTAGGIPLAELRLETMESRLCPGLFCCGEICDVDGRIGGYNFQWAWSSGYVAGISV